MAGTWTPPHAGWLRRALCALNGHPGRHTETVTRQDGPLTRTTRKTWCTVCGKRLRVTP